MLRSGQWKRILSEDVTDSRYALRSETGGFATNSSFVSLTGNQDVSGIKNFYSRPTVNGTGVLLVGEDGAASTGALTGAFYPLNANPSGYLTGVDLSNYVTKSSTGIFVTTGQTGNFITTSQTGEFVSTGSTGQFVTGNVVRPSQTGAFLTTGAADGRYALQSATGSFVTTSQTGDFVTTAQTGAFLTTGEADGRYALQSATGLFITSSQTGQFVSTGSTGNFVTGSVVRPSETGSFLTTGAADNRYALQSATGNFAINSSVVSLTGNQDVSGVKNFYSRPTVNGTGVLLIGESSSSQSQPNDANTIIGLSLFI